MDRREVVAAALLELTYLVPLRTDADEDVGELVSYLRRLAEHVDDVVVVDGSPAQVVERHRAEFDNGVRVLVPTVRTLMGKVGNVVTGLQHARHDKVVVADDDVRYTVAQIARMTALLDEADVVRPQNFFEPLPWHARVDTARTLLARVSGGDWPGTLGVQRPAVLAAGGYAGDVMFENLELVRTVRGNGGRELLALDLLVARRPPTTSHFVHQQVRQAYDEFARPERLAVSLSIAPLCASACATRRWRLLAVATAGVCALAEAGRRRAGGRRVFAASSVAIAPPWLVWRSLCSWVALGARVRGGVRYRGTRIKYAARAPRRRP
jgi:hypothetical protein